MNRLFAAGAVVAAVMAGSAGARADFRDGNQLYAECPPESGYRLFCQGYIAAITDAARHAPVAGHKVCGSADVTLGQMVDVVRRYLEAHPELRHFPAEDLVAEALAEAFPCR
jgi:hypothetical protein